MALASNTAGIDNTGDGNRALAFNTTGNDNTAEGYQALLSNTTGERNTAVGGDAGNGNRAGIADTFIGYEARPRAGDYQNVTALGSGAVLTASNSIVLGNREISAIYAKVPITVVSDRRLKRDIVPLGPSLGLAFIEKLKPVSYRFKNGDQTRRLGFVAQDLEQALPVPLQKTVEHAKAEHGLALIEREHDKDRTYRVSYSELTAPMVEAIQEQQAEIAAQRQEIAALRHAVAALRRELGGMTVTQALPAR